MTNLAEGFMLISEQEKSGKVERRKDMQTMTSAYANKMLKSLEEDKAFWLNKEEEACTYVAAINEEPVVPDYDYVEVATTIAALDEKIAIIKHELNVTNANAKVLVGDVTMSIDKSILAKGIPTLLEHPAHEVEIVNCIRESGSAAFMLNPFYRYIKPIRDFLEAAQIISKHAHLINASLECAIHVLYDGIDILGCALGGLSTWKLGNVAESYTTSMAGGGNRVISGIIGMVPVTFIVNTNVDRNDIDHPLHLYHRIELTFSTGRLCLVNTHGPVIWLPFLHMPRDEYGTLSINVEEEVNIPSGVTIGNVMLPSVKETFEQIWPDAVKKALEILFKQNRTEKMSMAQYQIYVSKLWSEICQKVGYMNIVDYDNFGDIKSIFYDLEKRHLIKKENDGIE